AGASCGCRPLIPASQDSGTGKDSHATNMDFAPAGSVWAGRRLPRSDDAGFGASARLRLRPRGGDGRLRRLRRPRDVRLYVLWALPAALLPRYRGPAAHQVQARLPEADL